MSNHSSGLSGIDRTLLILCFTLGFFALNGILTFNNVADGDLWARMAAGAAFWTQHRVMPSDVFAFTPTLPRWIDHEWGAGLIFYTLLRIGGPSALMIFKIATALAALTACVATARRGGVRWEVVLLLTPLCAVNVIPGYVPVVRSQALTYMFFAVTLLLLEELRRGKRWPAPLVVACMVMWTNVHGGFVSGLGSVGVYTLFALHQRSNWKTFLAVFACCCLATLVNPYGVDYWGYLIPALFHDRPQIAEWRPLKFFRLDSFLWFRALFVVTIPTIVIGWKGARKKRSLPGLVMLALTALLAWRSRRHVPFFGLCALCCLGPYAQCALSDLARLVPARLHRRLRPFAALAVLYASIFITISIRYMPESSFSVLAPTGFYPVREVDILMYSGAEGNVAVPFRWGSYVMWRLHPKIKVSMDGRYEEVYPESTFEMNLAFFRKTPPDWDRLIVEHEVDYVMLNLSGSALRPRDLTGRGYTVIYRDRGASALLARDDLAPALLAFVSNELPPETIQPLDPAIPAAWWP
ncbi:hypothetical protein IIC65_05490 [Candidatus Sumerlaeota bacterium]|nr:hypothetical protein [Candidatus Sumerlaeota bacterium]